MFPILLSPHRESSSKRESDPPLLGHVEISGRPVRDLRAQQLDRALRLVWINLGHGPAGPLVPCLCGILALDLSHNPSMAPPDEEHHYCAYDGTAAQSDPEPETDLGASREA